MSSSLPRSWLLMIVFQVYHCHVADTIDVLTISPSDIQLEVAENATIQLKLSPNQPGISVWWPEFDAISVLPNPSVIPSEYNKQQTKIQALAVDELTLTPANCTALDGGNCTTDLSHAFVRITIVHSHMLQTIIEVVGWIYFFAWSISFYPQIILNFRRKSVLGLNFDFLALNILGFICYSIYNTVLYWDRHAQALYLQEYGPHSVIPVQLNDVIFALHAVAVTAFTISQCFMYERGGQRVSLICRGLLGIFITFLGITSIIYAASVINLLVLIELISYVKLAITLIKYIPQAVMNFRRKSTQGWSIGNVLLDFTGGFLSLMQMFLIAYNTDDWTGLFGDFTKFGLGMFSLIFDVLFIVQHYVLYPQHKQVPLKESDNEDDTSSILPQEPPAAVISDGNINYGATDP